MTFPIAGTFNTNHVANDMFPALKYAIINEAISYRSLAGVEDRACVGMPFNGLNIPRFFWRVAGAPIMNRLLLPGAIHDHICFLARALPEGPLRDAERKRGDVLFREIAGVAGAGKVACWFLYRSVRIGAKASEGDPQWPNYIEDYEAFMVAYHKHKGIRDYDKR